MKNLSKREMSVKLYDHLEVVRFYTGIGNNAAITAMLDAHEKIKTHPRYRHEVKRMFGEAILAWKAYERTLLYEKDSYFDVSDFSEAAKKRYGNITKQEYFDLWKNSGNDVYEKSKPMINSLWNKNRLAMQTHGIEHADIVAWSKTALTLLDVALDVFDLGIDNTVNVGGVKREMSLKAFGVFSLENVRDRWSRAMKTLEPKVFSLEMSDVERKNIDWGVRQIQDIWLDPDNWFDSMLKNTLDNDSMFRTKGEAKKMAKQVMKLRDSYHEHI